MGGGSREQQVQRSWGGPVLCLAEEEQGDSITEMQRMVEDEVGKMPRGHIMKAL